MGEAPDTAAAPLLVRVEDGADADAEWSSRPHRIALFVEPSPFASVPLSLLSPLLPCSPKCC
jgi:hypothetical protein